MFKSQSKRIPARRRQSGGVGEWLIELADTNERMQKTVSRMFSEVVDLFAARFEPVVEQGSGMPSAMDLANQYLAILEGSIILAKAHRDPSRIASALRAFRENLSLLAARTV